jgi:4-hydroxy-4-methyl-2-oxoglutarate aldolase
MIEDPPLLTLRRNFPRPAPEALAALTDLPTGYLVDAQSGRGALDHRIKPLDGTPGGVNTFCGTAVTCRTGPDDNLALFGAIEVAQAGDVILAATDGFTGAAVIGDLVLAMAKNRGVVAFVTDGLVRDLDGIDPVGLPVFCRGVSPNSPARNGPGTAGLPVTLGGVPVDSGDVVVGDRDGVVVVPRARVDAVIGALAAIRAAEAALEAKVEAGLAIPDFIQDLLASDRVRWVD